MYKLDPKPNRKTAIAHILHNCSVCILTNSSYTVDPIPVKLTEVVQKPSTIKSYSKVFQKSKGVARAEP